MLDLKQCDAEERERQAVELCERPRAERRQLSFNPWPPAQGTVRPCLEFRVRARRQAASRLIERSIEIASAVDD